LDELKGGLPHKFVLENRESGMISGVKDVKSFDEKVILLATDYGLITIKGENMHVNLLDLEKGEVELSGRVDSILYADKGGYGARKGESLVGRLFQ
jgi:sporulation protein YabP